MWKLKISGKTTKTKLIGCLTATLVGIGAVVLIACIFHQCPVCQWNPLAWLAAAAVVALFVIGGICGR